jgi:hypothetical protein
MPERRILCDRKSTQLLLHRFKGYSKAGMNPEALLPTGRGFQKGVCACEAHVDPVGVR